jgi:hypothetical protein
LVKNYKAVTRKVAQIRHGWVNPPEGKVMVNVDATFDEDEGCGGVGKIIRDCTGGVLAASPSFVTHLVDALMEEA